MNRQPIRHAFDKLEKVREPPAGLRKAGRPSDETDLQVGIVIQPGGRGQRDRGGRGRHEPEEGIRAANHLVKRRVRFVGAHPRAREARAKRSGGLGFRSIACWSRSAQASSSRRGEVVVHARHPEVRLALEGPAQVVDPVRVVVVRLVERVEDLVLGDGDRVGAGDAALDLDEAQLARAGDARLSMS